MLTSLSFSLFLRRWLRAFTQTESGSSWGAKTAQRWPWTHDSTSFLLNTQGGRQGSSRGSFGLFSSDHGVYLDDGLTFFSDPTEQGARDQPGVDRRSMFARDPSETGYTATETPLARGA